MTVSIAEFTRIAWARERRATQTSLKLSDFDRVELRERLNAAVALMREATTASDQSIRARLAKHALADLFVVVAAAQLAPENSDPMDWPELEDASRIVAALPGLAAYGAAIAYVSRDEAPLAVPDPGFALLADLFAVLERRIDLRTARDLLVERWLRRGGAVLLLLLGAFVALTPSNLARGKLVTSSSVCAHTPSQPLGQARLARVVDGTHSEPTFAVCTDVQARPFITVDLGAPHEVGRIVVHGRNDGFWLDNTGPLEAQLSLDDAKYVGVAQRPTPILRAYPWDAQFPEKTARFVRIAGISRRPQSIRVSEIEVYGR